jgi:UDP:flavonoid glycosyltransferase YjiC (YdhE family)
MRILFSTVPLYGHTVPVLPLARAFREQGHDVVFVTTPSLVALLDAEKFAYVVAGVEIVPDTLVELVNRLGYDPSIEGFTVENEAEMFVGVRGDLGYPGILAAASAWRPDLIVGDVFDFVGPMVAATLGLAFAAVSYGAVVRPDDQKPIRLRVEEEHHRRGLEPVAPRWYLDTCPPSLQTRWRAPEGRRIALRPEAYNAGAAASTPAAPSPAAWSERPRVLVTCGTHWVFPEVLTPIIRELLKQDVDIRVTLGPRTPEDFEVESERVEFLGFTPLERLLAEADAVLSIGGAGTVLGSLAHGLPMVLIPQNADQPFHAERATQAGAAILFPVGTAEPAIVAGAVGIVLAEPRFREAARRVAEEIAAMPTPGEVARELAAELAAPRGNGTGGKAGS